MHFLKMFSDVPQPHTRLEPQKKEEKEPGNISGSIIQDTASESVLVPVVHSKQKLKCSSQARIYACSRDLFSEFSLPVDSCFLL